ncbi:MFS transporter [Sphingosinicella sp. BN140058]|uniref:MFS transporter n=1 Tax=Sphingosinicella sp. BN140058 TaxID=1892855 RepID=UPI001011826A|nr:MFS transporter [Sphingosinicella sp. BN140058]QAY77155.1 MFS transporter [Sphingosinicella sp. BN140058]
MSSLAADAPRPVHPRYPWALVALLWMVAFLNSADRSILPAVLPQLRSEFGLTPTQLALFGSVFFWIYAVAAFFFGRAGDSARRSRVILYGLIFWSIATGLTPLSTGFVMLLAFRGLVALGEASYYPTATALIGDWHRPEMRSRALSLHQTAVFAGAGLGALFAGMIADRVGWHAPFVLFAAIGLAHAFVLVRFLRDAPIRRTAAVAGKGREPIGIVLRIPPAVMLCAVFFLGTGASTGLTFWAPTYVHDALGLDLGSSALWGSATINLAGFLSVPLGGLLADTLARRTPVGRFYTLAIGLSAAAILLLPLAWVTTAIGVGVVLLATSIGKGLFDGCIYASMHDVVPPQARATAVGMMTLCGFIGAGITPIAVATAAERFGMAAGMTSLAALYVVAVVLILLMRNAIRRAALANAHEVA